MALAASGGVCVCVCVEGGGGQTDTDRVRVVFIICFSTVLQVTAVEVKPIC